MRAIVHRPGPWKVVLGVAAGILISGCPKNPTVVLTTVYADQTVPLLTQLNLNVSSRTDPNIHVSSDLVSTYPGLYDGGLPPFVLPAQFPISVDPGYLSGPVIIRVDGLDNDTGAILATGSTPAQIIPNAQTEAALTLSAGSCGSPDGGAGGDAGSSCDGGPDGGLADGAGTGG